MKVDITKKLQLTELEILKEIKRICDKHQINYFLMYGSLLGAVRHHGFIPWDDDIDIAMPRGDYEKFQAVAPLELKDKFELDNIKTNQDYYLPFIKVRNKLTYFEEKSNINYQGKKGIWVDIFPFDNTNLKESSKVFKFKAKLLNYIYSCLVYQKLNIKYANNVVFLSLITNNKLLLWLSRLLIIKKKESVNLVYYSSEGASDTKIYQKSDIFPLAKLEFENISFKVPKNYDKILTKMYGDYMTLPPVSKRRTHNPLKVKFEDGEEYSFKE